MGAWGVNTFEDDSAMDIYDDFCHGEQSVQELEFWFDAVLETDDYVEYEEGMQVLVGAEIIAAALGKPTEKFPDNEYHNPNDTEGINPIPELHLSKIRTAVSANTKQKAASAVEKLRDAEDIELKELWEDSDSFNDWIEYLEELVSRLE